jgi:hypothetical protein
MVRPLLAKADTARRLPPSPQARSASNAWIVRFDEVIQIEHNLLTPMHA